jgi:hypothetical protein
MTPGRVPVFSSIPTFAERPSRVRVPRRKPNPGGLYFQGKLNVITNPTKLTVVVSDDVDTHVVLSGWHPGKVIIVGPPAPVVAVFVAVNWGVVKVGVNPVIVVHDDDDDNHYVYVGKGKGKGKGK